MSGYYEPPDPGPECPDCGCRLRDVAEGWVDHFGGCTMAHLGYEEED